MENKTNYQRKLAHPDWQKKRLEVMQRDKFRCQHCISNEKELHVHHLYYLPNTEPHNYPLDAFMTLCYECHEREELDLKYYSTLLIQTIKMSGGWSGTMARIEDAIKSLNGRTNMGAYRALCILGPYAFLDIKDQLKIDSLTKKLEDKKLVRLNKEQEDGK